jgi:3-deoxy-D-arabino-heptulosonate 7-phosphate (DAHP) synthase
MPVQNGWITLDKKNADPEIAKIPVIVLSGWTQKAEPIVGATVLAKTVGADILLREIHRLSEKRLDP